MTKFLDKFKEVLEDRGPRERIFLFVLGFVIIYVICFMMIVKPVLKKKRDLEAHLNSQEVQKVTIQNQIKGFNTSMKDPTFVKELNQQKALISKITAVEKQLKSMKPMLVNNTELATLTKTILTHPAYNVTLVNLKDVGDRPWTPELKEKVDISVEGIEEHGYVIEFKSDYFSSIQYVTWLEKLPYNIYWDNLQYKVLEYPKANIIVSMRVLTKE